MKYPAVRVNSAAATLLALLFLAGVGFTQEKKELPDARGPAAPQQRANPGATAAVEAPKNAVVFGNRALDGVGLIGLPKEEALKLLGDPDQTLGPEEGYQTYDYAKTHQFSVVFHAGKLVQYVIGGDSKARTSKGVELGSHVSKVTKAYGDFTREEDVTEWFGGSDPRVLYHHAEFNKFKINYQQPDLIFMFDAERAVELIWVGFPQGEAGK
jgi:hypothetical protein